MKNKDHKKLVYLAGAIENAPDEGRGWRDELSIFIRNELNHAVYNPCLEESHVLTGEEFREFRKWKTTDLLRFRSVVHKIIDKDINMVISEVDYIICLWDEYVLNGGGTQGELTMAYWHKIPVFMVSKIPLAKMSSWIIGCTNHIFFDFESLKEFLKRKIWE